MTKYMSMMLDSKPKWKEHTKNKSKESNNKFRKMYWMLRSDSELNLKKIYTALP